MATPAKRRAGSTPPANILLIGLRGSGKSTIGPLVAARLDRQFIDLDSVTLWRLKVGSVEEAWREHGVVRFRQAEAEALRDALSHVGRVLAAGGGTPVAPGVALTLSAARDSGQLHVVYLRERPETLCARLARAGVGQDRPSLTGRDPLDEIGEVFADRDPLYRELATTILEGSASADEAAQRIIMAAGGAAPG